MMECFPAPHAAPVMSHLCLVCGAAASDAVPVVTHLTRSPSSLADFSCHHGVVPCGRSGSHAVNSAVCRPCYELVVRCDELRFAFVRNVECLKQKSFGFCWIVPSTVVCVEREDPLGASEEEKPFVKVERLEKSLPAFQGVKGCGNDSFDKDQKASDNAPTAHQPAFSEESLDRIQPSALETDRDVISSVVMESPEERAASQSSPEDTDEPSEELPKKISPVCWELVPRGSRIEHFRTAHPGIPVKRLIPTELIHCPSCPYTTQKRCHLSQHMKYKHGVYAEKGIGSLKKCPHCEATFKCDATCENHRMKVHGEEGTFPCDHCDRKFLSIGARNPHQRLQSKETQICEHCGLEVLKNVYRYHVQRYHKQLPKKTYTCEHCGKIWLSNHGYKQHLAREHGIGEIVKRGPKLKECLHCDKKIKSPEYFYAHLFLQHGVESPELKRYNCQQCDEVLYEKTKYEFRLRLHTGDRLVCEDCGYSTRFNGNLSKHRRTVHGKKKIVKNEGIVDLFQMGTCL